MSHFTVLVIGENPEKQLAPYHEFECTGENDEYVLDIDVTEETKEEYLEQEETRIVDENGTHYDTLHSKFHREPTEEEKKIIGDVTESGGVEGIIYRYDDWNDGEGKRIKVYELPEGYKEVEMEVSEFMSFRDYLSEYEGREDFVPFGSSPDYEKAHKFGYVLLGKNGEVEKVIRRTNPNNKWDWYLLGGRWTGYFKLKEGATGVVGKPGIMTALPAENCVDQAYKRDIDFESMYQQAEKDAGIRYDMIAALFPDNKIPKLEKSWKEILEMPGEGRDNRKLYHSQESVKAWNAALSKKNLSPFSYDIDKYQYTRDEYIARARRYAVATFAVIKDGIWYEKGEMGWWGCVSDEKDPEKWCEEFEKLLASVSDDTLLSVYDCHI